MGSHNAVLRSRPAMSPSTAVHAGFSCVSYGKGCWRRGAVGGGGQT
jgi:hypothetical protein